MTGSPADTTQVLLVEILDTVLHIQERIAAVEQRLDAIDAAQAGTTDLAPNLETLLAYAIESRSAAESHAKRLAELAAQAYAAACGKPEPLPVDVLADPVLERFLLRFPDGLQTHDDAAIAAWRSVASELPTAELTAVLERQYRVSATDTDATLVLRFQMAAVSRAVLINRGEPIPAAPDHIEKPALNAASREHEARRLARLWQGPREDLCAEPELVSLVLALEHWLSVNRSDVPGLVAEVARALETGHWPYPPRLPEQALFAVEKQVEPDIGRCD